MKNIQIKFSDSCLALRSCSMFFALTCLIFYGSLGQELRASSLPHQVFENRPIDNPATGDVYFELETLGFFKNNEFFHDMVDGYSLFGFNSKPKFIFVLSPEWQFEIGASSIWHFGKNEWRQLEPIGTISWRSGGSKFLFGSIDNTDHHGLIEPLSAFELRLVHPVENGLQYKITQPTLNFDLWLEWQYAIDRLEDKHEDLVGGYSLDWTFLGAGSGSKLGLISQSKIYHHGGQFSTSDQSAYTQASLAGGFEASVFNQKLYAQALGAYYKKLAGDNENTFQEGGGLFTKLGHRPFEGGAVELSYWYGHRFDSYQGGAFYSSSSSNVDRVGLTQENNQLMTATFDWQKSFLKRLKVSARVEVYYDLERDDFDFSSGLYIQMQNGFKIHSKQKNTTNN